MTNEFADPCSIAAEERRFDYGMKRLLRYSLSVGGWVGVFGYFAVTGDSAVPGSVWAVMGAFLGAAVATDAVIRWKEPIRFTVGRDSFEMRWIWKKRVVDRSSVHVVTRRRSAWIDEEIAILVENGRPIRVFGELVGYEEFLGLLKQEDLDAWYPGT